MPRRRESTARRMGWAHAVCFLALLAAMSCRAPSDSATWKVRLSHVLSGSSEFHLMAERFGGRGARLQSEVARQMEEEAMEQMRTHDVRIPRPDLAPYRARRSTRRLGRAGESTARRRCV